VAADFAGIGDEDDQMGDPHGATGPGPPAGSARGPRRSGAHGVRRPGARPGGRTTSPPISWLVAALGLVLLVAGLVGAAAGWAVPGLVIVFVAGVTCLVAALVVGRPAAVQAGGDAEGRTAFRFELSPMVVEDILETGLPAAAAIYSFVHTQLADDARSRDVRTRLQDQVVKVVQQNAFNRPVGAAEIERVLATGTQAERVLAFGLMQGDTSLATVPRLVRGIAHARSGNEQYHALLAAKARWPALSDIERDRLCGLIRTAPYLDDGEDRRELKAELLDRCASAPPADRCG